MSLVFSIVTQRYSHLCYTPTMKLYIARHGETVENKEKRILGGAPGILTPEGKAQGHTLALNSAKLAVDFILASDLRRVKDTCGFFNENLIVGFTPWLRERNFGEWEGSLRKEVNWQGLWESPEEPQLSAEIGAESLQEFTHRIARFAVSLHDAFGDTEKSILLISHIGVMNRFNFLSDPGSFAYIEYPNAEATEFDLGIIAKNSRLLA
jgi:broad specificity phosphatase PhoE